LTTEAPFFFGVTHSRYPLLGLPPARLQLFNFQSDFGRHLSECLTSLLFARSGLLRCAVAAGAV